MGSLLKAKPPYDKNKDGSDRVYIKIDKTVTLREGESLSLFDPLNKDAPDYVVFDLCRRNPNYAE